MRRALGSIILAVTLMTPGLVAAGGFVLGWNRGHGCAVAPPVVLYPSPYAYGAYVPGAAFGSEPVGRSYFRPEAPAAWNADRNWRDTWQDDGVKVHGYTWR